MEGFERTTRRQVLDRINAIVTRWRYLMWDDPGPRSIGSGLERTYRKGLAEFEGVRSSPSDRSFHSWRRRVKYLRYQLESLDAPAAIIEPFRTLGDDLGAEHDQTVLQSIAERHADLPAFTALVERSVDRRAELRRRAVSDGTGLFSAQPESFRHAIEAATGLR